MLVDIGNAGLGSLVAKTTPPIPYDKIVIDNNANAKNPVSLIFNLIHDVRYLYFQ